MKKHFFALFVIASLCIGVRVEAARAPELFVNAATGSAAVRITVLDADPNASLSLNYQVNGMTRSVIIGNTDANGNLSATVNSPTYGIAPGTQVRVVANGAQSPLTPWPNYTGGASLGLSSTSLSLNLGESSTITVGVSADLSIGTNSAPAVATASVSGHQIVIRALSAGTDTVTVCASGLGCNPITVTVLSSSGSNTTQASFSFSTETGNGSQINLTLGQSLTVPLLGNASHIFSVSRNSSPAIIGASANGATLYLTAAAYGGSNIEVCEFEGTCAIVYVYVAMPTTSPAPTPTPVTPVPTPTPVTRTVFTTYLKPGSTGTQVRALQTILIKLGYLKHVATGYYGDLTVDAVATLQKKHHLAALGVVGPATRALLNSMSQ